MNILVIGSGGREHALVWKLAQSPKVSRILAAPGNTGTARLAQNLALNPSDFSGLGAAVRELHIDLIVVGPEAPLADGIVDYFQKSGVPIFGPTRAAAEIESSKVFAKDLMKKYRIPCAASASFSDLDKAVDYVKQQKPPVVVKADGLAAGKGVIIANSVEEAIDALSVLMKRRTLGRAGEKVIIEEYLPGKEMSAFSFTDGQSVIPMVPACDYKRVYDGNRGPNTGGMGSYSPPPFYDGPLADKVRKTVMEPTVQALSQENRRYQGVLYSGLMINNDELKVLEFNARFGDPETQVVLPRLKTDLVEIMLGVINNNLSQVKVDWHEAACVGVVMASGGYPGSYQTGFHVTGLDSLDNDIIVFHAGTKTGNQGEVLTAGGRVLSVVAMGRDIAEARDKVYANLPRIHFEGSHYRQDIARI